MLLICTIPVVSMVFLIQVENSVDPDQMALSEKDKLIFKLQPYTALAPDLVL